MVDELGAVLNKYEVPMGLMNKLMMLSEFDYLVCYFYCFPCTFYLCCCCCCCFFSSFSVTATMLNFVLLSIHRNLWWMTVGPCKFYVFQS